MIRSDTRQRDAIFVLFVISHTRIIKISRDVKQTQTARPEYDATGYIYFIYDTRRAKLFGGGGFCASSSVFAIGKFRIRVALRIIHVLLIQDCDHTK